MGALGGLYRPTPSDTMVIWPTAGPGRQRLRPPASPPTTGARRLAGPADWLGPLTVAMLLMTWAWSAQCGYSPTAWRDITVATPGLFRLMACLPQGKGRPPAGGRPSPSPSGGASAAFRGVTAQEGPRPAGRTDRPSWGDGTVPRHAEISACTGHCSHAKSRIRG